MANYINLFGELQKLLLISSYHGYVGTLHENFLHESFPKAISASCDKNMLIWKSDRMTDSFNPTNPSLNDGYEYAKHEKYQENASKLLRQRYLMHHIVIGLQCHIKSPLLKMTVVERLDLPQYPTKVCGLIYQ